MSVSNCMTINMLVFPSNAVPHTYESSVSSALLFAPSSVIQYELVLRIAKQRKQLAPSRTVNGFDQSKASIPDWASHQITPTAWRIRPLTKA